MDEQNQSTKKIYPYIKNTNGDEYSFRKNMESINVSQYDKFVQNIAKKGLEQQKKDRIRSTKRR